MSNFPPSVYLVVIPVFVQLMLVWECLVFMQLILVWECLVIQDVGLVSNSTIQATICFSSKNMDLVSESPLLVYKGSNPLIYGNFTSQVAMSAHFKIIWGMYFLQRTELYCLKYLLTFAGAVACVFTLSWNYKINNYEDKVNRIRPTPQAMDKWDSRMVL